jgi:hypothetical protein
MDMIRMVTLLLKTTLLIFIFFILKEDKNMVDMYVALVINGRRTCNEENKSVPLVPKKWRGKVLEDLTALGLDSDGNPIE